MKLSIIILNYNAAAFLELCIYSVLRATKNIDAEIIVADNHSTDTSLQMLQNRFGNLVKVIAHDQNHGFSKGNNLAIAQAQGEYLCILNPDTLVSEQVFEECLAFAKAELKTGFIGVQLIDGTGNFLPESKRHLPTTKVALQKMMGKDKKYYYNEVAKDERGKVKVLVGAFMFCNKKVFDDCGGFDERYFMYGEDIDLSYTALQKGYHNYYLGDQKVIHFKGESTVKDKVYVERFYSAMQLFYEKHFEQHTFKKKAVQLMIQAVIALKKKTRQKEKPTENKNQIFITNQTDYYLNGVQHHINFAALSSLKPDKQQIIWDIKTLTFVEMINFMQQNQHYTFRFLSAKRDFYIGSDASDTRGEITTVLKTKKPS